MDLQLAGKRALVSGGSRGIGRAVARQLALEGCEVAIAARDAPALDAAAEALARETGAKVAPVVVDTGDDASAQACVRETVRALGGLDILVNAAAEPAIGVPPKLAEVTTEAYVAAMNVKVMGYLRMAREAAPYMTAQGWGRIVNVSGLNARLTGNIIGSMRNVSVASLSKNLADELGPRGVNVTCVHPGITRTEGVEAMIAARARTQGLTSAQVEERMGAQVAIGRIVEAAEVADVVAFLASPRSVAVNGDCVPVGGGAKGAVYY